MRGELRGGVLSDALAVQASDGMEQPPRRAIHLGDGLWVLLVQGPTFAALLQESLNGWRDGRHRIIGVEIHDWFS
jgi:hypothetical protein